ncbi:MAG: hypothetical protein QXO40_00315 [Candidatus Aenigmatarchaeota archaeon]
MILYLHNTIFSYIYNLAYMIYKAPEYINYDTINSGNTVANTYSLISPLQNKPFDNSPFFVENISPLMNAWISLHRMIGNLAGVGKFQCFVKNNSLNPISLSVCGRIYKISKLSAPIEFITEFTTQRINFLGLDEKPIIHNFTFDPTTLERHYLILILNFYVYDNTFGTELDFGLGYNSGLNIYTLLEIAGEINVVIEKRENLDFNETKSSDVSILKEDNFNIDEGRILNSFLTIIDAVKISEEYEIFKTGGGGIPLKIYRNFVPFIKKYENLEKKIWEDYF